MGLFESIKNIMTIPDDDEFDEDLDQEPEHEKKSSYREEAPSKKQEAPRVIKSKSMNYQSSSAPSQMQVVLVKPDRFEDVTAIADHLNAKKTVVLNLESANRETSRRIIDFLSGVAYANHGNLRKVANSTFIIVASDIDVLGELMLDDYEDNKLYY